METDSSQHTVAVTIPPRLAALAHAEAARRRVALAEFLGLLLEANLAARAVELWPPASRGPPSKPGSGPVRHPILSGERLAGLGDGQPRPLLLTAPPMARPECLELGPRACALTGEGRGRGRVRGS